MKDIVFKDKYQIFEEYTYQDFYYDSYLMILQDMLEFDKRVYKSFYHPTTFDYGKKEVKEALNFFDKLNIALRDVYIEHDKDIILSNPKDIPLYVDYVSLDHHYTSSIKYRYFLNNNVTDIAFSYIYVSKLNIDYSKIAYIHEITHSQVNGIYNINDELDRELLSIYMELLYAKLTFKNNKHLYHRLDGLKSNIAYLANENNNDKKKYFANKVYIKSTLQAIKLYNLYLDSNKMVRKEINSYIQKVFDKDILLEAMLNHFDINYESSKDNLRTLKRVGKK